jgi:hypothetical protein
MATTPKMIEASMNWRTTLSLNSMGTLVADVLVMGIGSGERHGGRAAAVVEGEESHLLDAHAPLLQPLRQKQRRKKDGEHQADEDGDGKNFHGS